MKNKKTYIILICFFLILIIINIFQNNKDEKKRKLESEEYVKNLHLKLIGKINDYELLDHDIGMLRLDVIHSNIQNYDVRGDQLKYFCVLHGNKAEVIGYGISEINIGDSVVIDSDSNLYKIYNKNRLILSNGLGIAYDNSFFSSLFFKDFRKMHHL